MIQGINDGIIAALKAAYPEVKCYDEQVKQGLKNPCFIIRCINPTGEQFLGKRYYRDNLFSVQYLPKDDKNANAECYGVQDDLYLVLEYITVDGDLIRGTKMRGEIIDGVLTFLVNYSMFIVVHQNLDPMEELTLEPTQVRGGS